MLSVLILALLTLLTPPPPPAHTYHLAPTGNDAADGRTPLTAWRTLARASEHNFEPGDTLLLATGATFEGTLELTQEDAGTAQRPVVVTSAGTERATIQNGDTTAVRVLNAGGVVIQNLILVGKDRMKNRGHGVQVVNTLPDADKRFFIRLKNLKASGFGRDGIWLGGAPADGSQSGFEDVEIARCETFDNQFHGIYVTGVWDTHAKGYANRRVHVHHCTAYANTGDPNFLENHSGSGMEIDDVEEATIEYCLAYENGFLCNARVGGPCGIWLHAATRSVIQHCVAINNRTGRGLDGAGFDLDGGTTFCTIQYCYARDNDGAGILVWNYEGAPHELAHNVIRFNILENNGRRNNYGEIYLGTGGTPVRDVAVYHNTLVTSAQPGSQARCVWVGGKPNEVIRFYNNLLIANGCPLVTLDANQTDVRLNGNTYWRTDGTFEATVGTQRFASLAAWQKATAGRETAGAFGDPKLTGFGTDEFPLPEKLAALRGYRPRPDSPLRGRGVDLKPLGIEPGGLDFFGKTGAGKFVGAGR